jgi:hypothetical protein
MVPNYASALILNNIVKAYNLSKSYSDSPISLKEFAANYDDVEKDLYLLYGLSPIKSNNEEFVQDILVLGKGLSKSNLLNNIVELPSAQNNQFGFQISEILGNNTDIADCYIFAAAYLTATTSGIDVKFSLGKSVDNKTGEVFILGRDVDLETAKNILQYNNQIVFPQPNNTDQYTLLFKMILDISIYDGTEKNSRVLISILDERKPRSFYSVSEENAAAIITPAMFSFDKKYNFMVSTQFNALSQIVNDWVNLDSWDPDFATYWYNSQKPLPTDLKDFIISIGIDISYHIESTGIATKQVFGTARLDSI